MKLPRYTSTALPDYNVVSPESEAAAAAAPFQAVGQVVGAVSDFQRAMSAAKDASQEAQDSAEFSSELFDFESRWLERSDFNADGTPTYPEMLDEWEDLRGRLGGLGAGIKDRGLRERAQASIALALDRKDLDIQSRAQKKEADTGLANMDSAAELHQRMRNFDVADSVYEAEAVAGYIDREGLLLRKSNNDALRYEAGLTDFRSDIDDVIDNDADISELLESLADDESISEKDKSAIRTYAREQIKSKEFFDNQAIADTVSDIEITIAATSDSADLTVLAQNVEQLFNRGGLKPEIRTRLQKQIIAKEKVLKVDQDGAEMILGALTTGSLLDTSDPAIKRGAERLISGHDLQTPEGQKAAVQLASVGLVPRQVRSAISNSIASGTVSQAIEGSNLVHRILTENPYIDLGERNTAVAQNILRMRNSGVMPETAVNIARHNAFEMTSEERARIDGVYRDEGVTKLIPKVVDDLIDDEWDTFTIMQPDAPGWFLDDYTRLVRQGMYFSGGDVDGAIEFANTNIRRTVGVSKINGENELMRHPVFGTRDDYDDLDDGMIIISGPETERNGSYEVWRDDNGILVPALNKDGLYTRWTPDNAVFERRRREEIDKAMKRARVHQLGVQQTEDPENIAAGIIRMGR